ncbi:2-amino-4-hydroxy-6-hydroxymethyldihydropteridine diphosphokinase [Thermomonas sp.]|uniref:2-amino-4-hydroxy-6- hydroxymethyldihydropteridine diphosphokinase n=1 Tax=Thermomonas sp. TaxID=1971895 RepID=UPI0024886D4C|nr:2-amino-4-hydroxy-6-hydroxymethyldihydropteridine diphosphokinase [Thermomonas sp.]MDI1253655.1 2-amino-4-hydroxy-6-hydroxymethyldihydropteridine diphosphokinase [Thermomonas sp.]
MVAVVGLGANLGDAEASVHGAIVVLDLLPATRLLRASKLYRTPAWGQTEQPDFINAVVMLETGLGARALLDRLLAIERDCGRIRTAGERWGPRTLDLDLLLFGDEVINEPGLQVPHPHLHERAFVLLPLAEIAPELPIPGIGIVGELAAMMASDGIEAIP